jgi:aminopeptidase N
MGGQGRKMAESRDPPWCRVSGTRPPATTFVETPMRPRRVDALTVAAPILFLVMAAPVWAQAPFSFDSAFGRLPKNVMPIDYTISIEPNATARTLGGKESVVLEFRQASATIVFNSLNERLENVRFDGQPVKKTTSDDKQQLTTVTLAKPAAPGRHTLSFSYRGRIESKPQGLFAQPFVKPGGGKDLLLSTQFEATDARRMFPCWDEPAFRATFELTVTVPAKWATISNMPIASRVQHGTLATISFQRTPSMPAYLLEFSAGDLAEITADNGGTRLGVWAVRGQQKDGAVALANAQQILADYNDYFGYPFPLPKLDSIALPGGFEGAMENWGAITYNDQILLLTASSTVTNRQEVFSVQAHEMAHQWNGDLVTMGWWDDLWLNESFASWMAAKETDLRNPAWHWWEAEDASKEIAMGADARVTSHAIQQHVTNELEAANAFDPQITYHKGQAVLRMLEAYLGPEVFREAVRGFMKARAYSNATTVDLWNALSAVSGRDIGTIAADWTEQPGFPVVSVASSCSADGKRTIVLSQKRFLLQGSDPNSSHWSVPLLIRSGTDAPAQPTLLTRDGQAIEAGRCDQALSVNSGAVGYYRVAYDDATLKANTANFGALPRADRIALLDDQWALVEVGAQELPSYLAIASAMGTNLDERAWRQITEALETIEYDERGSPGHEAFAAYARTIIKPVAARLGWESSASETPGIQKVRHAVLRDLGTWGDPQVIAEARKRFSAFVADRAAIQPDDQETVLSIVACNASAAEFEQLHSIAKAARNETELRRYYAALMRVRDPELAARAAKIALSAEIPQQADAVRVLLVIELNGEHQHLSWATYTGNFDALTASYGPLVHLYVAQYAPAAFWNSTPLDQLEAWIKAHVPAEMSPQIARGMETARFKLAEKSMLVQAADRYVAARPQHVSGGPAPGALLARSPQP